MNLCMIHENRFASPLLTLCLLHGAFRSGTRTDAFVPVINRRIVVEVDALTLMVVDPRPAGNVGNAVVISSQPGGRFQAFIHHVVQALGFYLVSFNGVGNRLWGVVAEMMILAQHGAQPADLPEQPLLLVHR